MMYSSMSAPTSNFVSYHAEEYTCAYGLCAYKDADLQGWNLYTRKDKLRTKRNKSVRNTIHTQMHAYTLGMALTQDRRNNRRNVQFNSLLHTQDLTYEGNIKIPENTDKPTYTIL